MLIQVNSILTKVVICHNKDFHWYLKSINDKREGDFFYKSKEVILLKWKILKSKCCIMVNFSVFTNSSKGH